MNLLIFVLGFNLFWQQSAYVVSKGIDSSQRLQLAANFKKTVTPPWLKLLKPKIPWIKFLTPKPTLSSSPQLKPEEELADEEIPTNYNADYPLEEIPLFWQNYIKSCIHKTTAEAEKESKTITQFNQPKVARSVENSEDVDSSLSDDTTTEGNAMLDQLQPTILKIINNFLIAHNITPIPVSTQMIDDPEPMAEAAAELEEAKAQVVATKIVSSTVPSLMSEELVEDEDEILKFLSPKIANILKEQFAAESDEEEMTTEVVELETSSIPEAQTEEMTKELKIAQLAALLKKFLDPESEIQN